LRDLGNTVLVVDMMKKQFAADYVVDLGQGAGAHGGELVAFGTATMCKQSALVATGLYIRGAERLKCRRIGEQQTENI